MFVPGGLPARRLGLVRFSTGSQRISYGSPSRRLPLFRCRDTVYLRRRGLIYLA